LPDKTGGVIAMACSLLVLFLLPFITRSNSLRSNRFNPFGHYLFWIFACNFLFLLSLGSMPIAQPYILLGQISTIIYFSYFVLVALLTWEPT
jgi:ubiquinol-cytochrome c reductase cytochrome b subunit